MTTKYECLSNNPLLNQLCGSLGTICLYMTHGYLVALQSIMIPRLRTSSLHLTTEQESWIPSMTVVMLLPTACVFGPLTDIFGRKWILTFGLLPQIITFIILYFAQDYRTFLVANGLAGLIGAGLAAGPMILAEISSPKYRGSMLNAKVASMSVGLAVVHCLGNFFDWRSLALCGVLPNLIGLMAAVKAPDSPSWLASKGRFEECKTSFRWYRGDNNKIELAKLIAQQKKVLEKNVAYNERGHFYRALKFLTHPGFLKAMALNASCCLFIEVCGRQIFKVHAIDTISSLVSDKGSVFYYAFGLDLAEVIAFSISCVVVKKVSRRALLFGAGVPALLLLLVISLLSFLFSNHYIPEKFSFINLGLILIYFTILNIAVIPNLYAITGEIYPLSHRGFGIISSGFLFTVFAFTVIKLTPSLIRTYGISIILLVNAAVSSLALTQLYFYLPETFNRTLQDVEEEMSNEAPTVQQSEQLVVDEEAVPLS